MAIALGNLRRAAQHDEVSRPPAKEPPARTVRPAAHDTTTHTTPPTRPQPSPPTELAQKLALSYACGAQRPLMPYIWPRSMPYRDPLAVAA